MFRKRATECCVVVIERETVVAFKYSILEHNVMVGVKSCSKLSKVVMSGQNEFDQFQH